MIASTFRRRLLLAVGGLGASALCRAQGQNSTRVQIVPEVTRDKPARWPQIREGYFKGREISEAPAGVIALQTPTRADDAAVVPVSVRALMPQTPERYIRKIYLVIDNNPSPVGAVFTFTPASGQADIETRVRVEEYTQVRAIAELNNGQLVMDSRFLKASGGCSAPAGKDAELAMANLGRMRLRVDGAATAGQPVQAQLMISHPNISGLAIDQLTRLAPAPRFVRHVEVSYNGRPVMSAEVDFTLSENPNLRFHFVPDREGELLAMVTDTSDASFKTQTPVKLGAAAG